MHCIDIFNGDADGLIARHQYRLANPVPAAQLQLISGVKRDIALVSHALPIVKGGAEVEVTIFDISYDQNAEAVEQLLSQGAQVRFFDHHRASLLKPHPALDANIDTAPTVCTSLLVDRHHSVNGQYRRWTIAAAFGDNLIEVATKLGHAASIAPTELAQLHAFGEALNYNAYGDAEADLVFRPVDLAKRLEPYADPLAFMRAETVFATLKQSMASDLQLAAMVAPYRTNAAYAIYRFPDAPWARRVSGVFANRLAESNPACAHALLTPNAGGNFTVSIRAPFGTTNQQHRADHVAIAFAGGGGRVGAAGINALPESEIEQFIRKMEEVFSQS